MLTSTNACEHQCVRDFGKVVNMRKSSCAFVLALFMAAAHVAQAGTAREFCLRGEFDLGVRYQGLRPAAGEFYPTRWCVVTEDASERVRFSAAGHSNPDMDGSWMVAFLPPDTVRIVNAASPPDIDFVGANSLAEARRNRRIDPIQLVRELAANPGWTKAAAAGWREVTYPDEKVAAQVRLENGRLHALKTTAELPLRGRVPVEWQWKWSDPQHPELALLVDGKLLFRARGEWRDVGSAEVEQMWAPTPGAEPRNIPGSRWPAHVDMQLVALTDGVYVIRNVRTGFHHLVVDTAEGLIVADAPAGWAELHQVPPAELVPGLAISGLSERLIDFLAAKLGQRPVRAVALTHAHDDHAGGARAFAAAGAAIYAPASVATFLETSLNRDSMPADRLSRDGRRVAVAAIAADTTLADEKRPVQLMHLPKGPHVEAALGVYLPMQSYFFQSDLHVPHGEANEPPLERARTECWFARWAVGHLPSHVKIINTHSSAETPVARLARYLESDICRRVDGQQANEQRSR